MEQPYPGRLRWEHLGGTVYLRLRAKFAWHMTVQPVVLAVVLLTGNSWRAMLLDAPLFGVVFSAFVLFMLAELLWRVLSQETLAAGAGQVVISRQVLGLTFFRRAFAAADIQALLLTAEPADEATERTPHLGRLFGFEGGTLFFSLPDEGVAFGRHLAPAEARAALRELLQLRVLLAAVVAPALAML